MLNRLTLTNLRNSPPADLLRRAAASQLAKDVVRAAKLSVITFVVSTLLVMALLAAALYWVSAYGG